MELREPFYALGPHFAIDLPGARAVFSTRRGGHSSGPYESLNLGWLTDDDNRDRGTQPRHAPGPARARRG